MLVLESESLGILVIRIKLIMVVLVGAIKNHEVRNCVKNGRNWLLTRIWAGTKRSRRPRCGQARLVLCPGSFCFMFSLHFLHAPLSPLLTFIFFPSDLFYCLFSSELKISLTLYREPKCFLIIQFTILPALPQAVSLLLLDLQFNLLGLTYCLS